ncbi:hypothetical protein RFI_40380 [Reticulomyxa filosa]|uniref:Uncharacterized protein n=1 Tax=Reticulomyxa filosa TaxID=46433 RepID=X6L6X8_RETFI|nr:hypothetical protein RFI_40380 [Reticulomyxa filosa]|eukprot:ETN97152.1 hypothetical protein RFI_40380 [Reticulomyxa filosa]
MLLFFVSVVFNGFGIERHLNIVHEYSLYQNIHKRLDPSECLSPSQFMFNVAIRLNTIHSGHTTSIIPKVVSLEFILLSFLLFIIDLHLTIQKFVITITIIILIILISVVHPFHFDFNVTLDERRDHSINDFNSNTFDSIDILFTSSMNQLYKHLHAYQFGCKATISDIISFSSCISQYYEYDQNTCSRCQHNKAKPMICVYEKKKKHFPIIQ